MLQDPLVKDLRLEGITSIEAANAFMPRFSNDYNNRFAKEPRNTHNAHRALRADEDLASIFSWRELRKVTKRSRFTMNGSFTYWPTRRSTGVLSASDKLGAVDQGVNGRYALSRSRDRHGAHRRRSHSNMSYVHPIRNVQGEVIGAVALVAELSAPAHFHGEPKRTAIAFDASVASSCSKSWAVKASSN